MLKINELIPYQSLLIAYSADGPCSGGNLRAVLEDLAELIASRRHGSSTIRDRGSVVRRGDLLAGFIHYEERRRASWTTNPDVIEQYQHVVVVSALGSHLALYFSDSSLRRVVSSRIKVGRSGALGQFSPVAPGILNAAFVSGRVTTLWLSGIHRRVSAKADNKVLSGLDLRDALDPLSDQTYHFTAARCTPANFSVAVGSSASESRIWAGASRRWEDFEAGVTSLLGRLEATKRPDRSPLPVVAISAASPSDVTGAYDAALVPPEFVTSDQLLSSEELARRARVAETELQVVETHGANFAARVVRQTQELGVLEFELDLNNGELVSWTVTGNATGNDPTNTFEAVLEACRQRPWLKIWYDSGHTLANGALFEVRHRDMPFLDFHWVSFPKIVVTKEKPTPLTAIGRKNSLFCWVQREWPPKGLRGTRGRGWLACDDGSMEIADFIHLDEIGQHPTITLIHVKGAGSVALNRGVSVSKYEVVVGQAVKNIRYLDRLLLNEGLQAGLKRKIGKLVWRNGTASTRQKMLEAMAGVGANYRRRVVVLQPQLTKRSHDATRKQQTGPALARLRQLDTLLLGAANVCHGLSAELMVIAEA